MIKDDWLFDRRFSNPFLVTGTNFSATVEGIM
jgi:hypothetical protein